MSGDPAYVCRTPVGVILFDVEDPLECGVGAQKISSRGMDNSLWFTASAAGVEQLEQVFTVHLFRFAGQRLAFHQIMPPYVTAIHHFVVRGLGAP